MVADDVLSSPGPSTVPPLPTSSGVTTADDEMHFFDNDDLRKFCPRWLENPNYPNPSLPNIPPPEFLVANDYNATGLSSHRPPHYLVWSFGLAFVTLITLCALVGIGVMKFLKKSTFDRCITFFVGVGVGSLSGSAVFHLLPQAFGLVDEFDPNASHAYLSRAMAAVIGIYLFFFSDKVIKMILETKKRKNNESTELTQINATENGRRHDSTTGTTVASTALENGHVTEVMLPPTESTSHSDNVSHSGKSLLIGKTNKSEIYHVERVKRFSEGDESYNRQAHSLCIHDHDMKYEEGDSVIATVAWMIIFGDGLHNLIDGISIGASFSESILSGLSVSMAVLCEEFPHELGDVAILVSAGMTLRQALVYNLLSALSCYIGFVIGVVVGNVDESFASYTFGFAGGMFLYISMACMMPEMKNAMEEALNSSFAEGLEVLLLQVLGVTCGLVTMACMARYGGEISFFPGT